MKLETLEKYIRYTAIPYDEIYKRAEKGGLKMSDKELTPKEREKN